MPPLAVGDPSTAVEIEMAGVELCNGVDEADSALDALGTSGEPVMVLCRRESSGSVLALLRHLAQQVHELTGCLGLSLVEWHLAELEVSCSGDDASSSGGMHLDTMYASLQRQP